MHPAKIIQPAAYPAPIDGERLSREHVLDTILHLSASCSALADEVGLCRIAFLLHEVNEEARLETALSNEY